MLSVVHLDRPKPSQHRAPPDTVFRTMIERIPGIVYTSAAGAHGEWGYVSPRVQSILGYSPGEWRANPSLWFERLHPEDRERALEDEAHSTATGEPLDSEYRMFARDGRVIWFHDQASLVRDDDGRRLWFEGVMLDVSDRKGAEAALRESEKRYRHIIETTHEGVWMIDREHRTTFVNPRMAEMLGYDESEMLGRPLWDFLDEEGTAEVTAMLSAKRAGRHGQVEVRYRCRDGSDLWALLSTSEVLDEEGQYHGAVAMHSDITERKQAEQEVLESRAQLAAAQGVAHVGSWEWDRATGALDWSDEHYRIFGVQPEEFVPTYEASLQYIHADDREQLGAAFRTAVEEKGFYRHECRIVRRDRIERVVDSRGHAVTGANGNVTGMVGTIQDVTERTRAEQEIRRRARHQAALASLGRQAVAEADLTDLMRVALEVTADILAVDDVRVLELQPDGQGYALRAAIGSEENLEDGAQISLDTAHRAVSATSVMIEDTGSPFGVLSVHTTDRRKFTAEEVSFLEGVANVLGAAIARDRADRLEGQLRQSQRLESIGQLAGGIAHDFNNLLSVILNYARFAIDELEDNSVREDVEEIKRAAERAADLTHQLLVFSRREVVQREATDINAIVRETEGMLARTLGEHIDMHSTLEPEVWPVKLGAGQGEQVLINLAVNCRDAMPSGGRLEISTANVELGVDLTRGEWAVPAGRYARLTVLDTGSGMDRQIAARAFDPFFTTKPIGSGTGLGLATVYGIVKQAGGYADISSVPDRGTEVSIYLPASDGLHATATPARRDEERPRGNGETILLVEDEPAVRTLTKRILSSNDYRVIEAADGVSALSACRDEAGSVDLLLTDVVLPHLSGTELAARMKVAEPGLKTLYMSGYSHVISEHQDIEEGLLLVEKPFSAGDLLRKVRLALHGDSRER